MAVDGLILLWSEAEAVLTPSKKKRKVERPVVLSSKLSKDHRSITTCILLLDRFIINLVSSSAQYILGLATHRHRERETSPSNGGCPRFRARVGPGASVISPLHAPTAHTRREKKKSVLLRCISRPFQRGIVPFSCVTFLLVLRAS